MDDLKTIILVDDNPTNLMIELFTWGKKSGSTQ
jgi:hypothetical protein